MGRPCSALEYRALMLPDVLDRLVVPSRATSVMVLPPSLGWPVQGQREATITDELDGLRIATERTAPLCRRLLLGVRGEPQAALAL